MNTLSEELFHLIHKSSHIIHHAQRENLLGVELQRGQGRLLRMIYQQDGQSQKELADRLNIRPASLSELISKLEEKGQVTRKINPKDRRIYNIYLTEDGKKLAEYIIQSRKELSELLFSIYTEEEKEALLDLLTTFVSDAPSNLYIEKHKAEYNTLLSELIQMLINEKGLSTLDLPEDVNEKWLLFRGLVNERDPLPISKDFLCKEKELLTHKKNERGITQSKRLNKPIALWKGDITTLEIEAIVNAANSKLLGCFLPGHHCVDNAIHTFAGVSLRLECDALMKKQGHNEPVGKAKITKAYNLPSQYIIHTVGPEVTGALTIQDEKDLQASYQSCLELAEEHKIKSIAFSSISTGAFGFPKENAANIAIETIKKYLVYSKIEQVVFVVFSNEDYELYSRLLAL